MSDFFVALVLVGALAVVGTMGADKIGTPGCLGGERALVTICR